MIGLARRSTMDIDVTIKKFPVTESSINIIFKTICQMDYDDGCSFEFLNVSEIREDDEYEGYRVHLKVLFQTMRDELKLDITTGDKITPKEIEYSYRKILDEGVINILSYNVETILAEKIECIISRGTLNTRTRDFYDVFLLSKSTEIDFDDLHNALINTFEKRGTTGLIKNSLSILDSISSSKEMNEMWNNFVSKFNYAKSISLKDCLKEINRLLNISLTKEIHQQ